MKLIPRSITALAHSARKSASVRWKVPKLTYTEIFGQWLCDVSEQDEKLIGITPAMREGSGMVEFEKQCPNRYYDVGIAEQHAVTFAAGMACEGYKPVVAIYSTFMQRAYDQLIHDVALQNLDVTFALDRAGLVGADGATHAGNYDLAFMRCIPNMVIMAPSDENECRRMLTTAYQFPGPASVRYPRGAGVGVAFQRDLETLEIGKGLLRREGCKVAILAFRFHACTFSTRSRRVGCQRCRHALRQTDRYRTDSPIGQFP